MIISASRRTDIPNYYSEWFYNRIKEGFLYVRNPMNAHQISKIPLSPDLVDCIVFWTKNPEPMIDKLDLLKDYKYYFQFSLTGYGTDIEKNIPNKKEKIIPTFKKLSQKIGSDKVIWRYDPILFNNRYDQEYHIRAFESIAKELSGYTEKCVISFVDIYAKNKKNMEKTNTHMLERDSLYKFCGELKNITKSFNMEIATCAEEIELSSLGIQHNCCIDKNLIEKITGYKIELSKDKNQRKECGCIESIDIGTYNTCMNMCAYCYANYSVESVKNNTEKYDPNSPLLCGKLGVDDKITEKKVKSYKKRFEQLDLWNL